MVRALRWIQSRLVSIADQSAKSIYALKYSAVAFVLDQKKALIRNML